MGPSLPSQVAYSPPHLQDEQLPYNYATNKAVHGLARYTRICQEVDLVLLFKPKLCIDKIHNIKISNVVKGRVACITY